MMDVIFNNDEIKEIILKGVKDRLKEKGIDKKIFYPDVTITLDCVDCTADANLVQLGEQHKGSISIKVKL